MNLGSNLTSVLGGSSALLAHRRAFTASYPNRIIRALVLACMLVLVVFATLWALKPRYDEDVITVEPPEVTARLIEAELLPEPPPALDAAAPEQILVNQIPDPPATETQTVTEALPPARPERTPKVDPDAGRAGRARAVAATAKLASATAALDGALDGLKSSLQSATGDYRPTRNPRTRRVQGGRSDREVDAVAAGFGGSGAGADLKGSVVQGSKVAIGTIAPSGGAPGKPAGSSAPRSGSGPGIYRSNASLLAVIQRYAAGIQYCYGVELKKDPALKGKLVVAMTVAASGAVTEATIVQNTVGSQRLAECALSQIREWRFPAIPEGVTTFQTPFVFTPPS